MTLSVPAFDRPLDGLAEFLAAAAAPESPVRGLVERGGLEVVGPFPSFTIDPRAAAEGVWVAAEQFGWRALVRDGEQAMTVVDLHEQGDGLAFGGRDAEAARAFAEALNLASEFESADHELEVRWLAVPELYVTALWLSGPIQIFIPTRAGARERPKAETIDEKHFRELVVRLLPDETLEEDGAPEDPADVMPGSHSGASRGSPLRR